MQQAGGEDEAIGSLESTGENGTSHLCGYLQIANRGVEYIGAEVALDFNIVKLKKFSGNWKYTFINRLFGAEK